MEGSLTDPITPGGRHGGEANPTMVHGRRFGRPGPDPLLAFDRPGDVVCAVRLDRLGRSLEEPLETVDRPRERRLEFRPLEERPDTASAAGGLVPHAFGAIARFERRPIVERTRDGIGAALGTR